MYIVKVKYAIMYIFRETKINQASLQILGKTVRRMSAILMKFNFRPKTVSKFGCCNQPTA